MKKKRSNKTTIKNSIALLILLFLNIQTVFCQPFSHTNQGNLEKYWHYRYRLTHYFMVIGDGSGESLPADIRNHYCGGRLSWQETPIALGYYIGVLSTEYHLLKQNNQNTDQTLTELYYALKAVERLDKNAEGEWPLTRNTKCQRG